MTPSGRPRRRASRGLPQLALTAIGVFALALLLVSGAELFIGHPISGGRPGQTTMTAMFVTSTDR
ncbi:hypothetical protein [Actinomycetospora sp.]|uniref:hypothetical protein n=1 Tax=Actinomycetospora sp. TaxID=1872135 RepID=UPI002F3F6461